MTDSPQQTLFPLARHPTTRQVAERVKTGGVAALTEAERRADEARYQEVVCRSALNRVEGMPFRWTLNPYRGCTHGCHYCFARRYHTHFEMNADDEFASVILVKKNFVEVLRRELDRRSWKREIVAVGTATDPYQPIEGQYRLTRGTLAALASARTPVGLVTKGPMVVRDVDLLQELSQRASVTVYVSVPSVDEDAWRRLEPGTAHPLQRLRAVRTLVDAGIRAGVLMAPIVPGITSDRKRLADTMNAIADHGAQFVGANLLYLKGGTRTHFLQFLAREYPELIDAYRELYGGGAAYVPDGLRNAVRATVRDLRRRAGLIGRDEDHDSGNEQTPEPPRQEQAAFEWRED
ncbi:MAG TPA: radical SAM protein [Vicinamibacterales bacterium]|nr:radical SAM protein [Vicinamibacterales bacterium]